MSMHNTPLTLIEREGLEKHGLPIGKPSQPSDTFPLGVAWALAQQHTPFGYVQYVDKFGDYEFNKCKKDCRNDREAIPVYTAPQAQQGEPVGFWEGGVQQRRWRNAV